MYACMHTYIHFTRLRWYKLRSNLCMYVCMYTVDVVPCQVVEDWMKDFESYQNAVDMEDKEEYMGSLNRSLSLAMEEFYR